MVSLQSHASLSLRHNVTGTDTVTWSVDNRIAITSQDIVYVFVSYTTVFNNITICTCRLCLARSRVMVVVII